MGLYVIIVVLILIVWAWKKTRKPANFPPGPPRAPIVGSVPFLKEPKNQLVSSIDLREKYGKIFGYFLGNTPVVNIGDLKIIKDLFKQDVVSARPAMTPFNQTTEGWQKLSQLHPDQEGRRCGVLFSHGTYNKEIRRFLLRNLR